MPPPRLWITVSLPRYPGFPSRSALPARRFFHVRTVFPFRRAPSARRFRPVRAVYPFCRAPSARGFRPARANFPLRRALPARSFLHVRTVFPFRRAPSTRRFRPVRAVFPLRRSPSARSFRPARANFPLRRALFARRSRLSIWFPVAACVTRSASLSVRPVSCSVPFSRFLRTVLSAFRRLLLYSTNIFALWRFARQTVTLGFGITHLCCAVACVCTLY